MMNDGSADSSRTDPRLLDGVRDPRNHAAWEKFIAQLWSDDPGMVPPLVPALG